MAISGHAQPNINLDDEDDIIVNNNPQGGWGR